MVVPSSPRVYMPPHTLLSNDIIDAHVATARNQSAWSKEVRDSEFPALWAVLGQNSAIQDHYVNAALYGQGHSGQVTAEVTQLRNILLNMQPPARVVCETGFNAGRKCPERFELSLTQFHRRTAIDANPCWRARRLGRRLARAAERRASDQL